MGLERGGWTALAVLVAGVAPAGIVQAQAQTQPNVSQPPTREEVQRVPVRPPEQRTPRLTVDGGVERAPCALADPQYANIRFTVRSVAFDDLRGLSPADLAPAYQPYVGTEQPVSIICEIRDRAATILRNAGYIAAVEVPEQRIGEGNVRFTVLMARLVGVRVRGNAGRAEQTIANYLQRLTDQPVFNRFDAERYLLLAGDIPGYDVRLALRSAQAGRGEVIGEVAVLRVPAEIDVNVQNFGSKDLGRFGGLVRGQFYGLTGLGDRTTIAAFSTLDFEEQQTIQLGHDFRLGGEGLTLSGQFTYAWAEPDLNDENLRVRARTLLATAEASYPFVRSQKQTVRGAIGFDLVNQRVALNGLPITRDRLRVAYVRLDADTVDEASLNSFGGYSAAEPRWRGAGSIQARKGLDVFGASEDCGENFARCSAVGAVPLSRLEGDPTAFVVRGEVFAEYRPDPRVTFALGVRGQYGADPLLSFEEFSAGNYTVGRGYDPGTLLGDSGIGAQFEVRYGSIVQRSAEVPSVQPYLFFDAARVSNKDRLTLDENQELYSAGGGVRGIYKGALFDLTAAFPLKRAGLLEERPDARILFSITTRLFPWSF